MRRAVVAVLALARADEVRFAAKVSSWWHSDVAPTFETLEAVARTHLRKKDYGAFQRATGTSVGELLAGLRDCDANATRDGATLPHEALPAEYVAPRWWCPAKADDASGLVDGDGATVPAVMRVVYEVVGGRLPFSFMSELQVSLALPGSKDQHFAAEASVVDRVAGSVLSEPYQSGEAKIKEWAVVSQLARFCQVSQVCQPRSCLLILT